MSPIKTAPLIDVSGPKLIPTSNSFNALREHLLRESTDIIAQLMIHQLDDASPKVIPDSNLNPTTKPTRPKVVVVREAYYATPSVAPPCNAAPADPSALPGCDSSTSTYVPTDTSPPARGFWVMGPRVRWGQSL
ncbi:hypothetical protein Nepgr_032612 [Nepenthes gracilis]|uniref:Uncharacterized protein n=1 Tax=Nepenthes gracilis TaxID=150966 RepID=A0AAD3TKE8_NEPGR|nr:hypothetical protein Nepgr_032612 [Nepenthes gracilis]